MTTRREFLKQSVTGAAALSLAGMMPGLSAKSYAQVKGANEKIRAAVVGVNSRGRALSKNFAKQPNFIVTDVCDVDTRANARVAAEIKEIAGNTPKQHKDIRLMVEDKGIDAVVIATPDHWHALGALIAMKAGKQVYLEKPISYSAEEGELLIQAVAKYKTILQVGNQRRSWPNVIEAINTVKSGEIGRPYYGKAWYANNRASIGHGKEAPVPEWLDWDLWQGPATRMPYRDNIVHYNWHWFYHWGTAESGGNGIHSLDLLLWGMGEEFATMVNSAGGRYRYNDDWQWPDTQSISFEFGKDKLMSWEGRSCNNRRIEDASVGAQFFGEGGSVVITAGNEYKVFDLKNKLVRHVKSNMPINELDRMNPAERLDTLHIQNFARAITHGEKLAADIVTNNISTVMLHTANIAQRLGRSIKTDPRNGHIIGDRDAQKMWGREYAKGFEMKI